MGHQDEAFKELGCQVTARYCVTAPLQKTVPSCTVFTTAAEVRPIFPLSCLNHGAKQADGKSCEPKVKTHIVLLYLVH